MGQARIGRIRMKAGGAEVRAFRPGAPIVNDRRANFLRHTAASFDSYRLKYGDDPDAMVMVLGGLKQTAEAFWIVRGDSEGGGTTMLAFAQSALQREISNP
jgi:hypothetical protein